MASVLKVRSTERLKKSTSSCLTLFYILLQVIKQSHIILSFLAMECKITNEHIDVIWQAAQLKHCSKQVHDLLPPLIKHLEAGPVLHLYRLLCRLEPRDHTEQVSKRRISSTVNLKEQASTENFFKILFLFKVYCLV